MVWVLSLIVLPLLCLSENDANEFRRPRIKPLSKQTCKACEGGVDPMKRSDANALMPQIAGWELTEDGIILKLKRSFIFKNFKYAMNFVNQVAAIAEQQAHHPNIEIISWNKVNLELYTHAISGLSINDFICAAQINELLPN